jgi:hypothetical protein
MSLSGLHSCMERCISGRESAGVMNLVSLGCVG